MNIAQANTPQVFGVSSEYLSPLSERVGSPIALGHDAFVVMHELQKALIHFFSPATHSDETLEEKFVRLAQQWKQDTAFTSSVHKMSMHPSYQQIIGTGKPAIPLILEELRREPGHWFWALHAITGIDVIPPCDRGDIPKMTEAWLAWGRANGFLEE